MASPISRWLVLLALALAACATQPDSHICTTGIICPETTKCAAVQPVCITNDCGDGVVQTTEKCDDGNIEDGDGCAANCLSRELCGDGVLNQAAGELCDDGNMAGGDGCSADCRSVETCGNGIRDVNEVCDDGNTVPGDGCSGNCKSTEICGNGIVDINEKCDDGGAMGGCNPDCQGGTGCGDGAIDKDGNGNPLEECDDGNSDNQDDCTNNCHLNKCQDGIVQTSGSRIEQCDPAVNFGETASCNIDCTSWACGDGKINNAKGEECDEGLANGDDRDCTTQCHINVCGDGLKNQFGPGNIEQCDDGNLVQTDGCSNECTTPTCGNGIRESTEACDDGNLITGDGCSSTCLFEACGDGIVNNGEACDPGPAYDTTTCNSDCTSALPTHCGDSKINMALGEECDDGNNADGDACRMTTCKLNICGDGDKSTTEGCDDGNRIDNDGCNNACQLPSCGDGVINGTDQCDDGLANSDNARCLTTCILNTCGDGKKWTGIEECDNGAGNGPDKNCTPLCKNNVCGDGYRDQEGTSTEACDDGNTNDETSCPYGVATCTLCNHNCAASENNLTGNVCGDGVSASPEACDDGNAITDASCPYGTTSSSSLNCNVCNATCAGTVSRTGPYCGDGVVETSFGEGCDDGNANACGRCDAGCNAFASSAATGYIVAADGAGYQDNDTLTVNDGFGHVGVIEFDKNGSGLTSGNVLVTFTGSETADSMHTKIKNAINAISGGLIAAADGGGNLVTLTHTRKSSLGNVAMTDTINSSNFVAFGMSGGAGGDCANSIGCTNNDDCQSHNCTGGTCQP